MISRIGHALVWLVIVAIPMGLLGQLGDRLVSDPSNWPDALLKAPPSPRPSDVLFAVSFLALLGAMLLLLILWIQAVHARWSLKWPLIVVLVASIPLGLYVPFIVSIIGLAMLSIQLYGRGGALAPSSLADPVPAARPRGLVESIDNE